MSLSLWVHSEGAVCTSKSEMLSVLLGRVGETHVCMTLSRCVHFSVVDTYKSDCCNGVLLGLVWLSVALRFAWCE